MRWESFRAETERLKSPTVGIGAKGYELKKNDLSSKNWFHSLAKEFEYFPEYSRLTSAIVVTFISMSFTIWRFNGSLNLRN
ncbi:hypothetical protein AYB33_02470 [Leptospira santarosai]|nr:hypothetical protein AYB33_02470 [Leptospira santarosai]